MDVLHAHPIDPAVRARIEAELRALEARHRVRVLYACESGSRGWGFASPDSDYDVRFIYVHDLDWYLRLVPGRDVIELPISDELDINGWDLRKALGLLGKSNPVLLEWLDSPVVYRSEAAPVAALRELARRFFAPVRGRHHYLAMARKNFRGYLQGDEVRYKKYLYVLRPLLAVRWIDEGRGVPPMRFAELAQATVYDQATLAEINALLRLKMTAGEAEYGPRRPLIHRLLEAEFERAGAAAPAARGEGEIEALDAFFRTTVRDYGPAP